MYVRLLSSVSKHAGRLEHHSSNSDYVFMDNVFDADSFEKNFNPRQANWERHDLGRCS